MQFWIKTAWREIDPLPALTVQRNTQRDSLVRIRLDDDEREGSWPVDCFVVLPATYACHIEGNTLRLHGSTSMFCLASLRSSS
jgi:hypothetical protein